jgi:hypothetical protein
LRAPPPPPSENRGPAAKPAALGPRPVPNVLVPAANLGPVSIFVDTELSNVQQRYVMQNFGVYIEAYVPRKKHTHPISHIERLIAEEVCVHSLREGLILDIGGNARRHATMAARNPRRLQVHCACPILEPADVMRRARYLGLTNYCDHVGPGSDDGQPCNCHPFSQAMSVHVLYYQTKQEVLCLLSCLAQFADDANPPQYVAAFHLFPGPRGRYHCGESEWSHDGGGRIQMTVAGNNTPYLHRDPTVEFAGGYYQGYVPAVGAFRAMAWSQVTAVGNTVIYRFMLAPVGMTPPRPVSVQFLAELQHSIADMAIRVDLGTMPADAAGSVPTYVRDTLEVSDAYSVGDYLILAGPARTQYIPIQAVWSVASQIMGKKRDASQIVRAYAYAKSALDKLHINPQDKLVMEPYVAAMGYTVTLETELQTLASIKRQKPTIDLYNALLVMGGPTVLTWWSAIKLFFQRFLPRVALCTLLAAVSIVATRRLSVLAGRAARLGARGLLTGASHLCRRACSAMVLGFHPHPSPATAGLADSLLLSRATSLAAAAEVTLSNCVTKLDLPNVVKAFPTAAIGWLSLGRQLAETVLKGSHTGAYWPSRTTPDAFVAALVVAAPVIEETLKFYVPGFTLGLSVAETISTCFTGGIPSGPLLARQAAGRLALHFSFTLHNNLLHRIVHHSIWNLACACFMFGAPAVFGSLSRLLSYPAVAGLAPSDPRAPGPKRPTLCFRQQPLKPLNEGAAVIVKGPDFCQITFGNRQCGPATTRVRPIVSRSCIHNELVSIRNRVAFQQDTPDQGVILACERFTVLYWHILFRDDWVASHFPVSLTVEEIGGRLVVLHDADEFAARWRAWLAGRMQRPISVLRTSEWLTHFPASKRLVLAEAASNVRRGVDWRSILPIDHFVKRENLLHEWDDGLTTVINPRAISARKPEYQVLLGPFYYQLSKEFLSPAWSDDHFLHYCSGYTAQTLGAMLDRRLQALGVINPVYYVNDMGMYDATQGEQVRACQFRKWRPMARDYPALVRQAIDHLVDTHGHSPHGVTFRCLVPQKHSGDPDTSVDNSELDGTTHCFALERGSAAAGLDDPMALHFVDRYPVDFFVLGDDNFAVGSEPHLRALLTDPTLSLMGFITKAQLVGPEMLDFCSSRFFTMLVDGQPQRVLVPKLGRCAAKLFYMHKDHQDPLGWARGVAECMQLLIGDLPYFRLVIPAVLALTAGHRSIPVVLEAHKFYATTRCSMLPETWSELEATYGVARSEWESLEQHVLSEGITLHSSYDHPVLTRLIEVDVELKPNRVDHHLLCCVGLGPLFLNQIETQPIFAPLTFMSNGNPASNSSVESRATRKLQALVAQADKAAARAKSDSANARRSSAAVRSILGSASSGGRTGVDRDVVRAVLGYLCDPFDFTPVRYSGPFATRETAVNRLFAITTAGWNTTDASPTVRDQLPLSDTVYFLFRDPRRCSIMYDANAGANTWSYTWTVTDGNGTHGVTDSYTIVYGEYPRFNVAQCTTSYAPHQVKMISAEDDEGVNYFWVDATSGAPTTLSLTNLVVSAGITYVLRKWVNGLVTEVTVTTATNASGVLNISLTSSGYYTFTILTLAGALNTTTMRNTVTGTSSVYCHNHFPGLSSNIQSAPDIRTTAAALMYTNDAAPLYRQGKITAFQAMGGEEWTQYGLGSTTSGVFSSIASLNGSRVKTAENGLYAFLKPSDDTDFDNVPVADDVAVYADSAILPYPLVPDSDYLVVYCSISQQAGRDGYWTPTWGIEYETQDNWHSVAAPIIPPDQYMDAVFLSTRLEQFHENPLHLSDITSFLRGMVGPAAAGLSAAAAAVPHPAVSAGMTVAGSVLSLLDAALPAAKPTAVITGPGPQQPVPFTRPVNVKRSKRVKVKRRR